MPLLLNENDRITENFGEILLLVKALMAGRRPYNLDLIHQIATCFEKAEPRYLVTFVQLQDLKVVVNTLWDVLKSDDRRKRITAA